MTGQTPKRPTSRGRLGGNYGGTFAQTGVTSQPPGRGARRIAGTVGGAVVAAAAIWAIEMRTPATTAAVPSAAPAWSAALFEQLRPGLSYGEVRDLLGGDGVERARTLVGTDQIAIFEWTRDGAAIHATFQNGTLVSRAQAGLR
jgi:hypothetical protein